MQTLLNELGFWQLNRGKEKRVRIEQLELGGVVAVKSLVGLTNRQIEQFQRVDLLMKLSSEDIILLDNKINNKRPGYHVLNVAKDEQTGKNILVNRGWLFAGNDRNQLPDISLPAKKWKVNARIYPIQQESISTAKAAIEKHGQVYRLPVLDHQVLAELEKLTGLKLEKYLLRLDKDSQSALAVNWMWTNMPPEKHLAYAFQWFALALAFLIVSVIVCIKKR